MLRAVSRVILATALAVTVALPPGQPLGPQPASAESVKIPINCLVDHSPFGTPTSHLVPAIASLQYKIDEAQASLRFRCRVLDIGGNRPIRTVKFRVNCFLRIPVNGQNFDFAGPGWLTVKKNGEAGYACKKLKGIRG